MTLLKACHLRTKKAGENQVIPIELHDVVIYFIKYNADALAKANSSATGRCIQPSADTYFKEYFIRY